jgi:RNA polymerase sigma-70 factor (ECF subfamily)
MLGADRLSPLAGARVQPQSVLPAFEAVYDAHFPYIWRAVQRLGVHPSHVDDVVQEVFLTAHRKLGSFEGRSGLRTWLYGIALRTARAYRRRVARDGPVLETVTVPAPVASRPDARAEHAQAVRVVNGLLDALEDDQREVFVLTELEQLSAPEIAEALGLKLNTVYSRLRRAREAFAAAAARYRAKDRWRDR